MIKRTFGIILIAAVAFQISGLNLLAQGAVGHPCHEGGPYTNTVVSCGSVDSQGQLSQTTFCVNWGDSIPIPSIVGGPTFNNGSITTTTTYDCSQETSSTSQITYSPSSLLFNPPPPHPSLDPTGVVQPVSPGTYTSHCYVVATSSDTNCAPFTIDYGNVTWNVNTPPVTATIQITPSKLVNAINNISANISSFDSGFKPDPIAYNISLTAKTTQKCCDDCCNAGYEKTVTFSGAIKGGGGGEFPLTGIPHIASINATLNASFSLTLGGGGFTPACATEQQYCGSLTLSGTIGGGFSGSVGGSKILYCSVTIQGDVSGSGQACVDSTTYTLTSASVTGCLGPISVEGNAKLFSGLSFKINYQLVPKFCSP